MKTRFVCGFANEIDPEGSTMPAAAVWLSLHSLDHVFHQRSSCWALSMRRNDDQHRQSLVSSSSGSVVLGPIPTNPAASFESHNKHNCAGDLLDEVLDKKGIQLTDSDLDWYPTKRIGHIQQHNEGRFLHEFDDIGKSMERVALVTVRVKSGRRRTTITTTPGTPGPGKEYQLFNT